MRRTMTVIVAVAGILVVASPAGAATTAWTAGHLTRVVKFLVSQNVTQNKKLSHLRLVNITQNGRITALELRAPVPGPQGEPGTPGGPAGESAYQVWLDQGNTGTAADFLASLKGATGDTGATGATGPAISTHLSWVCVLKAGGGKSASFYLGTGTACAASSHKLQVYVP